jgi:hypothetical protein
MLVSRGAVASNGRCSMMRAVHVGLHTTVGQQCCCSVPYILWQAVLVVAVESGTVVVAGS